MGVTLDWEHTCCRLELVNNCMIPKLSVKYPLKGSRHMMPFREKRRRRRNGKKNGNGGKKQGE